MALASLRQTHVQSCSADPPRRLLQQAGSQNRHWLRTAGSLDLPGCSRCALWVRLSWGDTCFEAPRQGYKARTAPKLAARPGSLRLLLRPGLGSKKEDLLGQMSCAGAAVLVQLHDPLQTGVLLGYQLQLQL